MTVEERAAKIISDSYFNIEINGKVKKFKIPTKYVDFKISEITSRIDFDINKLSDETTSTGYALMLNSTYAKEMVNIIALILYGRKYIYRVPLLGSLYMKLKTRKLMHILSNQSILDILLTYIKVIDLMPFIQAMRYIEQMGATKAP